MADKNLPATTQKTTAHIERLESIELAGGQYWRAVSDIPAVKKTYSKYENGHYETDGRNPVGAGTVLLVKSLRHVDGELHTVILAPHPSEGANALDRRFLVNDFFGLFEIDFDHQATRSREIAALESEIQNLRFAMMEGPADLPKLSAPTSTPSVGSLVARSADVDKLKQQAGAIQEIAQKRADFVQEKNKELSALTGILALFHQEQATAAIAAVEDTLRMASHLQDGVQTLGLYTGEGVVVRKLCDGAPSGGDGPLHMYQRKLYMDEEWVVHALNGGADADDIVEFGEALASDSSLMMRIMPVERCVVLMAYRREGKEYFRNTENPMMSALANAFANMEKGNSNTFLLVRNGEQVWQIFSEVATNDAKRLFPTSKEVSDIYKVGGSYWSGIDATEIKASDLTYTDRREAHDKVALFYKRLLVLLWGLDDRLGIFGTFYDRQKWQSWLSLEFQQANFTFIHDDENALVDHSHPDLSEYISEANKHLQPGSRIAVVWNRLMTGKSAPGAVDEGFNSGHHYKHFKKTPVDPTGISIVSRRGDQMVVTVPCKDAYDWKGHDKTINVSVSVSNYLDDEYAEHHEFAMLCLDAVRSDDLDHYINSRAQRTNYLEYIPLFVEARDRLRVEEEEARPFVDSLVKGLLDSGVSDTDDIFAALATAIRIWRAGGYGKPVPAPSDKGYKKALKAVGKLVYAILGKFGSTVDKVAENVCSDTREPLRLVMYRKGDLFAYLTPRDDEVIDLGTPHPWVRRVQLKSDGRLPVSGTEDTVLLADDWMVMPKHVPTEAVIHEWPAAKEWIERPLPETNTRVWDSSKPKYTYEDAQTIRHLLDGAADTHSLKLLNKEYPVDHEFEGWVEHINWVRKSIGSDRVFRPQVFVPLAIVALDDPSHADDPTYTPYLRVMGLTGDALGAVYQRGGKDEVIRWCQRVYRPEIVDQFVEEQKKSQAYVGLHFLTIQSTLKGLHRDGYIRGNSFIGGRQSDIVIQADLKAALSAYREYDNQYKRYRPRVLMASKDAESILAQMHRDWSEQK